MINEAGEGGALFLSRSLFICLFFLPYNILYIYGIPSLVSYRWGGAAWVNERVLLTASVTRTAPIPCRGDRRAGSGHEIWLNCLEINLRSQRECERERERVRERRRMGLPVWGVWADFMWIERGQHGHRHRELSSKIISVIVLGCLGVVSPSLSLSLYLPLSQFNEFLSVFLLTDLEIISFTRFLNPLLRSL